MKLENIFFKSFFYPFLLGIFLTILVIEIFLGIFTNYSIDKHTKQNIINIGKNKSKMNINSAKSALSSFLSKFQAGLNELVMSYQKIAKDLLINEESYQYQTDFLKSAVSLDFETCDWEKGFFMADWLIDEVTTNENLEDSNAKLQLKAYSNILKSLYIVAEASNPEAFNFIFYFEDTEVYIFFPLIYDCGFLSPSIIADYPNYRDEYIQCLNEQGEYYTVYKIKCEAFFQHMKRAKTNAYDNNYSPSRNKTILINNFYEHIEQFSTNELTMCIEFQDPISKGNAYACVDIYYLYLLETLNELNLDILGYYFVSNIGFNNVFYFPESIGSPKIPTEYIYDRDTNYKLNEKIDFNNIKKIFSSNYIDYMGESLFDEVYVNGKNSSGQYFFKGGKKLKYSIYPVVLENLYGQKEHVFSVIHVYDEELLFEEYEKYFSSITIKIILELAIFIIFFLGLLYLIYLTLNTLSKYIVIPIKNVNYMLKGINIGGTKRLQYLNFLKKKQDDSIEKLESLSLYDNNNSGEGNKLNDDKNNDISNNIVNNLQNNKNQLNKDKIENFNYYYNKDLYDEYKNEYDKESDFIEKETNFYDFDEQLLQNRPLEVESLAQSLSDLKNAFLVTSKDRQIGEIINYSSSENIFRYFKNKEGVIICQSNIGNLQSRLLKYDKAIYHLVLSLQDNKLKRFLNKNLTDELDESDALLNKISYSFYKEKEENNILSVKQFKSLKDTFSQKTIGVLINTRYSRLIYAFYNFFKNLQKLKKSDINIIKGQFINTNFHTINYYHKIIIQYIFLCFFKNDLVKIGESILDYIEFLIKFKFKSSLNDKDFLTFENKDKPEYKTKQEFKKKIFKTIINWFNLFEEYITHVKDNSTLSDLKSVIEDYSKKILTSENTNFFLESQSSLMFKLNIQRYDFLRGKFCLSCQNYNDALFYFIRASQVKCIVIDGLIKKRSLKHIYKISLKIQKDYENFKLMHLFIEKELKPFKKDKIQFYNKDFQMRKRKSNIIGFKVKNTVKFGEEIEKIKKYIIKNISESNEKQEKEILIMIDFNLYQDQEDNLYTKTYKIDVYIEQIKMILNNYLSRNDKVGILIYTDEYQIVCPLMRINKIDINSFFNDLIYYKNKTFNLNNETGEYGTNSNEFLDDISEFIIEGNEVFSENYQEEESSELAIKEEQYYYKLRGLVKGINFINNYFKIKREIKNEKYIILFTDIVNVRFSEEDQIKKIMNDLCVNKGIIFILVGKIENTNIKGKKSKLEELIINKFGEKSEIIYFENINKIKTILSNKNVIKDEIISPNEIY